MANRKISDLQTKNTPAPGDLLPIVDTGVTPLTTKKTTFASIISAFDLLSAADVSTVAVTGSYNDLTNKPAAYSLPTATNSVLGGVKIGGGISINSGVISVSTDYAATVHGHEIGDVEGLQAALDSKATPADVTTAIQNVIDGAPQALDTLNELAAALGDDGNFAVTITNALADRPLTSSLAAVAFSGSYEDLIQIPETFSPSQHAASHGSGGNDPIYIDSTQIATVHNGPTIYWSNFGEMQNAIDAAFAARPTSDTLASVAFSNSYTDLADKPNIVLVAPEWSANHTLADGTRYLANDVVYSGGNVYRALYENESEPVTNATYWLNLGAGSRINIDGRDIPNIPYPVTSVNGQTGAVTIDSGNPFDQDLNTTDSPQFGGLTVTGGIDIGGYSITCGEVTFYAAGGNSSLESAATEPRTWTLPDASGTVVLQDENGVVAVDALTVTNGTISSGLGYLNFDVSTAVYADPNFAITARDSGGAITEQIYLGIRGGTAAFLQSLNNTLRIEQSGGVLGGVSLGSVTFADGTTQTTAGGGNPFDQSLNTTDSPTFDKVYIGTGSGAYLSSPSGLLGSNGNFSAATFIASTGIQFPDGSTQTTAASAGPYALTFVNSIEPVIGSNTASGAYSVISGGGSNQASASFSTVAGGNGNVVSGEYSVISGGVQNTASGSASTISGGQSNDASGSASTISGGVQNTASGDKSTASGGRYNTASGSYSAVNGGWTNTASGTYTTIGGGRNNTASGTNSTVSGGQGNTASNYYSTVSGGISNNASGYASTVSGGFINTASGVNSTVGGGNSNNASGANSTVSGGISNTASADYSTVSGGKSNIAGNSADPTLLGATVGGGRSNIANNEYTTVGGGKYNSASGRYGVVAGGVNNSASGNWSAILGGTANSAGGVEAVVGGGDANSASGDDSGVFCGQFNTASAFGAFVGGGTINAASGNQSTVSGGQSNAASGQYSTVSGGKYNTASADYSTVSGGQSNAASGGNSTVGGGETNNASATYSAVVGGRFNTASGNYSSISGGKNAKTTHYGSQAHASGQFSSPGDAQRIALVARRETTDATQSELFLDGATERMVIPGQTAWNFDIKLSAYSATSNIGASWNIRGAIRRDNADSTVLIGSNISENWIEAGLDGIAVSVTADDTNEALVIQVTGLSGNTIRWVASVEITQVSFGTP